MLRYNELRLLWTVSTTVQRTNERVAGITGINPFIAGDYWNWAIFEVRMVATTNLQISELRIYGSLTGFFPPVASPTHAYCVPVTGSAPALTANQGVSFVGALNTRNVATIQTNLVVPPRLLLEYSTTVPGATPNLNFEVRAGLWGGGLNP